MAAEKTEKLGLTVYPDIADVYQRELRQSYLENFMMLDTAFGDLEERMQKYVNERLGAIESGTY
jgi:hypothetical protein